MVPTELEQWISSIQTPFGEVKRRVDHAVRILCDQRGYAYSSRVKDNASLAEKLETGRIRQLEDIDDLFAMAVIIPNLSHEHGVLERLHEMFDVHDLKERGTTYKSPDVFRFDASRFIGRLRVTEADNSRLGEFLFEIQVRTAFEHAWSVATHSPAYKPQGIDWKLERLAAQMKALVEQLDSLAVAYEQAAGVLVEHPDRRIECETRVFQEYQQFALEGLIPTECAPQRWGLLAKNIVSLADAADWKTGKRIYLDARVERLLSTVGSYLREEGAIPFPLSLSIYQFTLGVLVQKEAISPVLNSSYFAPVSAALEMLFPRTRDVIPRCRLEVSTKDQES